MNSPKACVQYGCGLSSPPGWWNFDASPTLRVQRLPVIGHALARGSVRFPPDVRYGDVVRGLPLENNSCQAVYASHVLEHLCLNDLTIALAETKRILKIGGRFRLVVPDLETLCSSYLKEALVGDCEASHRFMRSSHLGLESRERGLRSLLEIAFGNSKHLWMWDRHSMPAALHQAGFSSVREARFGDSEDSCFNAVEDEARFVDSIAFEAVK